MNPYFNQSQEWKNFFLKANNDRHDVITIEYKNNKLLVYQYPFLKNDCFWYVPRLSLVQFNSSQINTEVAQSLIEMIRLKAIKNNISYINFDFDKRLLDFSNIQNPLELNPKLISGTKKIQYLTTPILDVSLLNGKKDLTVQEFFEINEKTFFGKVNKTCRNLTRRALEKDWKYEVVKDEQSFEQFWTLWQKTAKKHSFNLHKKQYILDLLSFDWAQLIVIKDQDNTIQSGGIIININDSVIHLFGTNSDVGLERGSQYFFHVVVLKFIREKQLQSKIINTYDLGGSDDDGYGNFKKSYKPNYLEFDGPYEIVLKPLKVKIYNVLRKLKNLIKS